MPLLTPRRRISTRTRQRYFDIKQIFRKALGSSLQTDNKTASIASCIDNSCCEHTNFDIDEEYDEENACCSCSHDEQSVVQTSPRIEEEENYPYIHDIITEEEVQGNRETVELDTKLNCAVLPEPQSKFDREIQADIQVEKTPSFRCETPLEEDHEHNTHVSSMVIPKVKPDLNNDYHHRTHRKKSKTTSRHAANNEYSHRKRRDELVASQSESAYYHNLTPRVVPLKTGYSYEAYNKNDVKRELRNPKKYQYLAEEQRHKKKIRRYKSKSPYKLEEEPNQQRKPKIDNLKLDHDFIAGIIRKQYKPTPIFDRRRSDMSQFSAPVCRDRDFSGSEATGDNAAAYSCHYQNHNSRNNRYITNYHEVDLRSLCDTQPQHRQSRSRSRRRHNDIYNDSTMYDIIPVKEKSSPKFPRRHEDYQPEPHDTYHKEVPPSPRTRRPRLNLQSQYDKYCDIFMSSSGHTNMTNLPHTSNKSREQIIRETETDVTSETHEQPNHFRNDMKTHPKRYHDEVVATSNTLLYEADANCTITKTHEMCPKPDNTDKALREIKDILQNFLHEIKKDSPEVSFRSDEATKTIPESVPRIVDNTDCRQVHCNTAQCSMASPFLSPLANSCYPVLPVCPMNCVQSGYIVPHPSFTCLTCKKSTQCQNAATEAPECSSNKGKETDELVKEIYKLITLNPRVVQKEYPSPRKRDVEFTTRSVGSNFHPHRRDAKVGTPKIKYQSRSCEAIGSRSFLEPYTLPHASYSDTVIEKLSVQHVEESEMSTNGLIMEAQTRPHNKFSKVLHSIGIRRKKSPQKDSVPETGTSGMTGSTPIEFRRPKPQPPFRQEMQAFMMHGAQYENRSPYPHQPPHHGYLSPPRQPHSPRYSPPDSFHQHHGYGDIHSYDTRKPFVSPPISEIYHHPVHQQPIYEHEPSGPIPAPYPPYDLHYNMHPPQIPLCLKEIEVKSISTQSEKKLSFFRRFTKKRNPSVILTARTVNAQQNDFSTQTAEEKRPGPRFQWGTKKVYVNDPPKRLKLFKNMDPLTFGYDMHKKLAEGDIERRDALLDKILQRRSPFSPKTFLMKSILGKSNKKSFGEPNIFKHRFFF